MAGTFAILSAIDFAHADGTIRDCKPMPDIIRFGQPNYPTDLEIHDRPSPVSVLVEFVLSTDGSVSGAKAIESDAGYYRAEFEKSAVQALTGSRFKPSPRSCRGRIKVVFKIVE